MQLIRSWSDHKVLGKGLVLAIGNFDGMHLGHQAVIQRLIDKAHALGLESAVMTFEPHPRQFFRRDECLPRLSTFRDKFEAFETAGIDKLICIRFCKQFADLTPQEFVHELLVKKFVVKHVIVGSLFFFGKGGAGDFNCLKSLCKKDNITAESLNAVSLDEERVSSTLIRSYLAKGDCENAARYLGRPYSITGRVAHGNTIGRTLGYPTANIELHGMLPPLRGVYAVRVHTSYGVFDGMCNAGERPSIREVHKRFLLEAHLFNFNADIYSELIKISFISKIRDETVFSDLDELKKRLKLDRQAALEALKKFDS